MTERDNLGSSEFKIIFKPPVIDAENQANFEKVWSSGEEKRTSYSLVQVPVEEPVALRYSKPRTELDFTLTPTEDPDIWKMEGDIDSDIVELSGQQVAVPRLEDKPPVMTGEDVDALRHYGEVDSSDPEILVVSLTLPTRNVTQLLTELWSPRIIRGEPIPKISLKDNGTGNRVLPQKSPPEGKMGASLTAIKPPVSK